MKKDESCEDPTATSDNPITVFASVLPSLLILVLVRRNSLAKAS